MQIREETLADEAAIGALITAAFRSAPHAAGTEAEIVTRLRAAGGLILSLLAEDAGGIIGHIAASPGGVGGSDGWWCLGPVAVHPDRQRAGIGSALIGAALTAARAAGAPGAALVGDPLYYGRFGFTGLPGLRVPGVPGQYVLALLFAAAAEVEGVVRFHPAFGIDYG